MTVLLIFTLISASPPPDLGAIITNLGVFSLAVAAVVGGTYKAIQEIKKAGAQATPTLEATAIFDAPSAQKLLSSFAVMAEVCSKIERHLDRSNEKAQETRDTVRSSTEEMHRLRVAMTDLHQHMRKTDR